VDKQPCRATDRQGRPCRSFALPSGLCWHHDPERAAERRAACVKGGKLKALQGRRRKLTTPAAVVDFLSGLAHDLAEGRKDPELVRAVAYVLSVQLKAVELAERSEARDLVAEVRETLDRLRRSA
jgi:hypothetical protein